MEKFVAELKTVFQFKDTTEIGDIILIVSENPKMMVYAVVTDIERDGTKQDEWWHLGMQVLAMPPQKTTWTLRTPQFTGMEIFTMGGEKRFIKAIDFSEKDDEPGEMPRPEKEKKKKQFRVIK